ncbi:hypothetical protein V7x_52250 [Crateriforma conspicua]|uniref:Uncharacterized protein n=1 Tax=Crateriforma conspicua TaxID=2527996 RepID=A0A5C6FN10_9PLAN|nr:hypothetical protein [Crateriforma conspicua]TWU60917.1 hypothetical protein V7x_52250 [Crateriforma conspicua]
MKSFTLTHLLLLVTWCAIAFVMLSRHFASRPYSGDVGDLAHIWSQSHVADATYLTVLSEEALANAPRWHPADPNPPVSARAALAIADRHRSKILDDDSIYDWRLDSVSLLPLDAKNDKWCWSIYFAAFPKVWPGPNDHDPFLELFVLMDGSIVPSERRDLSQHIPEKDPASRRQPIEDTP